MSRMFAGPGGGTTGATRFPWQHFLVAAALALAVGTIAYLVLPAVRVGDGMEYYALFFAWNDTHRPWMSDAAYALYQQFHQAGAVAYTMDRSFVEAAFPALRLGETSDFNHFWLYSLLAAIIHKFLMVFGLSVGPHGSFMALHVALFLSALAVAALCDGRRGVWVVIALVLGSPIIWYFNKVHTEFFTFCLTLAGVILAMRNQLVAAALPMAIAATQNPGLSFVPVLLIALRGLSEWHKSYSRWELAGVVLTVLLLAAHPVYYFLRFGVMTPQLLAGGAAPGEGLSFAYIWLFDPDVGLFPSWPGGLLLVVGAVVLWRRTVRRFPEVAPVRSWHFWPVIAVFLVAALYSHASTTNLNSGATPGLARYALWYIPLVYPAALIVFAAIGLLEKLHQRAIAMAVVVFCVAGNAGHYLSVVNETYTRPSLTSRFIQKHMPWLYSPPAEIFLERYSSLGESAQIPGAIVGPDCSKILLLPLAPEDAGYIYIPYRCGFSADQIRAWVASVRPGLQAPIYDWIDPKNADQVHAIEPVQPGSVYRHNDLPAAVHLTAGWSVAEAGHRWSDGDFSQIRVVLSAASKPLCLQLTGLTYGRQTIGIAVNGGAVSEQTYEGRILLNVPLGAKGGEAVIDLNYSNAQMPPADPRRVAFALQSLNVDYCG